MEMKGEKNEVKKRLEHEKRRRSSTWGATTPQLGARRTQSREEHKWKCWHYNANYWALQSQKQSPIEKEKN